MNTKLKRISFQLRNNAQRERSRKYTHIGNVAGSFCGNVVLRQFVTYPNPDLLCTINASGQPNVYRELKRLFNSHFPNYKRPARVDNTENQRQNLLFGLQRGNRRYVVTGNIAGATRRQRFCLPPSAIGIVRYFHPLPLFKTQIFVRSRFVVIQGDIY